MAFRLTDSPAGFALMLSPKAQGVIFGGVTAGVTGHRVGWREIFPK